MMILDEDGEKAVRLARRVVEAHLNALASSDTAYVGDANNDNDDNYNLSRNTEGCGVFVTLNYLDNHKQEHLRGCVGFPIAEKSLYRSIIEASIARSDTRPKILPG